MATSTFGLGRRRWSSPQQCYLHRLWSEVDNTSVLCTLPRAIYSHCHSHQASLIIWITRSRLQASRGMPPPEQECTHRQPKHIMPLAKSTDWAQAKHSPGFNQRCLPSVLWHCWLVVRKSIWPVKTEWRGGGVAICLERGADCLHMVQLMPLASQNIINSCVI